MKRRSMIAGAMAFSTGLTSRSALADQVPPGTPITAVSDGGFRYLVERASPFSGGVATLAGYRLVRVRLRTPLPLEHGLDLVAHHLMGAHLPSSALAGLELRAPRVMTRPAFAAFNARYLAALRARGLMMGEVASVARSDMVPMYDPPQTDLLAAFTYTTPTDARAAASDIDFLLSGRPEYAGNHVIAPGDVSSAGIGRKAGFVFEQLRRGVVALGGRWSDITGAQIYMTEPLLPVMEVLRATRLIGLGVSVFAGSTPVIGFDGVTYAFEADVRAIGLEQVI